MKSSHLILLAIISTISTAPRRSPPNAGYIPSCWSSPSAALDSEDQPWVDEDEEARSSFLSLTSQADRHPLRSGRDSAQAPPPGAQRQRAALSPGLLGQGCTAVEEARVEGQFRPRARVGPQWPSPEVM